MTKRFPLLFVAMLSFITAWSRFAVAQQSSGPEQEIRKQIAALDAAMGASMEKTRALYTPDAMLWTNAYSKPHAMSESIETWNADRQAAPGRQNQVSKTTPNRIVVARGGDMAHEYSTFHLSYDDNKGHTDRDGALLRVWQLQGSRWLIAAEFRRPYGQVVASAQPAK